MENTPTQPNNPVGQVVQQEQTPIQTENRPSTHQDADNSNIMAAIGYLFGIFSIIIFLLSKNKFVRFHTLQAVILSIAFGATWRLSAVLLYPLGLMLAHLLSIAYGLGSLFLCYKTFKREQIKLPFIGDLAEKYS